MTEAEVALFSCCCTDAYATIASILVTIIVTNIMEYCGLFISLRHTNKISILAYT